MLIGQKLNLTNFNQRLLGFLDASPTPFHATANIAHALDKAGAEKLLESESWKLKPSKAYYVTRNESSIVAFRTPKATHECGFRMIGAHTDSPCLKLKPNSAYKAHGYWQLGVEVYGGVLLNPWFDRDLSLAGRVTIKNAKGKLANIIVNAENPIAIIPSLAIHLDREANKQRSINAQTYLPPIITGGEDFKLEELLQKLVGEQLKSKSAFDILDFELSLYPTEKASLIGLEREFIAGARLDNLLSCFVAMRSMLSACERKDKTTNQLIVCNDHEEVGSSSAAGARGTFLNDVLNRIVPDDEKRLQTIANSMMVSTDNAHGIHPNFADKHDSRHGPLINRGPVIKVNSNQSYATNSESAAIFKIAAEKAEIPIQHFVTRTDLGCGSTIGPLTATALGVRTIDVGVPTFAMHSARELAGKSDAYDLYRALLEFNAMEDISTVAA